MLNNYYSYEQKNIEQYEGFFNKHYICKKNSISEYLEISSKCSGEDDSLYPSKVLGNIEKRGEVFRMFNHRYLELDLEEKVLKRYKSAEEYPDNPLETISLQSLKSLKKLNKDSKNEYFQFEMELELPGNKNKRQIYRVKYFNSRAKWLEMIKDSWLSLKNNQPLKISKKKVFFIDDTIGIMQPIKKEPTNNEPKISTKNFKFLNLIGCGGFSLVYQVVHIFSNKIYAMKVMNKTSLIQSKQFHYMLAEYKILKQLVNFPFILTLHYAFQTSNYLFMILDYCPGGDCTNIKSINNPKLFMAELVLTFEFLHAKNIIYRDLKPENILLTEDGHIKLCDFNLSKENITDGVKAFSFCGSPMYLSPEMLSSLGVDKACDIYGLGLIFYEILCGEPVFNLLFSKDLYKKIMNNEVNLDNKRFSLYEKDLLSKMLTKDPNARINIFEVKMHKYFEGINWAKVFNKEYGRIEITKKIRKKIEETPKMHLDVQDIKSDYKRKMKNRVRDFFFINKKQEKETEDFSVNLFNN